MGIFNHRTWPEPVGFQFCSQFLGFVHSGPKERSGVNPYPCYLRLPSAVSRYKNVRIWHNTDHQLTNRQLTITGQGPEKELCPCSHGLVFTAALLFSLYVAPDILILMSTDSTQQSQTTVLWLDWLHTNEFVLNYFVHSHTHCSRVELLLSMCRSCLYLFTEWWDIVEYKSGELHN